MSNEQKSPTCLVALRAEIGALAIEFERRMEHRVGQCEQAFSSMGWETDTLRANLKQADTEAARLLEQNQELQRQENAAQLALGSERETSNDVIARHVAKIEELQLALSASITPAQACEQINKVHDEYVAKLSAERKELELTQRLLQQARNERDEARLSRQACILENRGVKNLNRAQARRIEELKAVAPALDILSDMVKELQGKLEESEQRRMATEDDFGKLVGEHEDHVKKHEVLRNLLMGNDPTPDCDRYTAFAISMGTDRHTAKMAVHRFVQNHPMCTELQRQLDLMVKRTENEPPRVTAEEMFVRFKPFVYDLLKCIYNMTNPAVSALQYGGHHGHQTLHKHIVKYRRFVDDMGRKNHTSYADDVPDEVLRDHKG